MKCGTCNATFQDNGSLEIHYQYTHSGDHRRSKEFAASNNNSIGSQPSSHESSLSNPDVVDSTETNNNRFYKFVSEDHLSSSSSAAATGQILRSNSNASANAAVMTAISPGIVHSSSSASSNELGHGRNEQFLPQQPIAVRDLIGSPYDLNSLSSSSGGGAPTILNSNNSIGSPYDSNYSLTSNDFARCSPHLIQYSSEDHQRYHPYYKPSLQQQQQAFSRNQFPPSSSLPSPSSSLQQPPPQQHHQQQLNLPLRCDKCEFICFSQEILLHHLNSMHHGSAFTHFGYRYRSGVEPSQAEILDLDSHKVHVYQPPVSATQDHQRSALESWMQDSSEKKFYPTHHQNGNNGGPGSGAPAVPAPAPVVHSSNGTNATSGATPLPSPDFGNVSTTTDNIDSLHSSLNSPFRSVSQFDHHQAAGAQITTSAGSTNSLDGSHLHNNSTGSGKKSSTAKSASSVSTNNGGSSGGGGSWKSNEPRRPKTYNCSACNKWFTSSGHLKRHYNTTLHKNAVKQSGAPDPATMPISAHHHPHKDPSYVPPSSRQMKSSPPSGTESSTSSSSDRLCAATTQSGMKANDSGRCYSTASARSTPNQFYAASSNVIAPVAPPAGAASDISGGLVVHPHPTYGVPSGAGQPCNTITQTDLIKCSSPISQPPTSSSLLHPNHSNYHHLSFAGAGSMSQPPPAIPLFQQPPTQSTFYPNFQSPHVSTIRPVTTITNHSGNDERDGAQLDSSSSSLPSFSCIQRNNGNQQEEEEPADNSGSSSTVANNLWNYAQYFGLDQLIGTLHNNGNVGGHTTESRQIDSSIDNNNDANHRDDDENTPPSGVRRIKVHPPDEDELASEEEVYTELFNGRKFAGPDTVSSGYLGQCRVSAFQHVPDTKIGFISPKREDSSLYDDENTTVSSSTIDSVIQPIPSSPSNDSINSGGSGNKIRRIDGSDVGQFQCEKCQKVFNKACYLTQHNKSFHSGYKPYKCARCGKRFTDVKQYKDHIDKHAGDKPHKCEICPKQFNHKTDLRRHVCLHTNIRPHTCDLCQKGFIRKDHMLKHRETHANRKQILRHTRLPKLRKQLELQVL